MIGISKLDNPIQHYAWGSRTGIARFLGGPHPTSEPEAELWMGAHPKAPSTIQTASGTTRLNDAIRAAPREILGERVVAEHGETLPFLLKILAAGRALSIQAHPDRSQAAAGCRREDHLGIPRHDPRRNYRDVHHKPEVLFAVTPFWILRGFRPASEILELMMPLGLPELLPESSAALRDGDVRRFFASYLALDGSRLAEVLPRILAKIERDAQRRSASSWVLELERQFPGDRGVLAPLFLHLLELMPGEAMFTGPGILHAYLEGVGIELMANSDNVVRGGLTGKHVDRDELLSILRFETDSPRLLHSTTARGERVFDRVADEFALSVVEVDAHRPYNRKGAGAVELLLCATGSGTLRGSEGNGQRFAQGDSFLVPASVSRVQIDGNATLFRATVPGSVAAADAEPVST